MVGEPVIGGVDGALVVGGIVGFCVGIVGSIVGGDEFMVGGCVG